MLAWFKGRLKYIFIIVFLFVVSVISGPIDTTINYLYSTPNFTSRQSDSIYHNLRRRIANKDYTLKNDFYFLFRFRNSKYLPLWERIQSFYSDNPVLTLHYLNASLQIRQKIELSQFTEFLSHENDLIRESAANLFGERGDSTHRI